MSRTPLSQAQAEARLIPQGITASSTGRCTTRSNPSCTSYEGILSGTVDGVVGLKQAAGVSSSLSPVGLKSATQVVHTPTRRGCKVDIRHSSQLDNYIKTTFTKMTNRGDGYPQWRDAKGNTYCDEGHHWDVTYR